MKHLNTRSSSAIVNAYAGPYGILLMALTWAAGWGLGIGGLMELIDSSGEIADIWFSVLGIPGFATGLVFWIVLRIGEGSRRIDEIAPARLGLWGAVTGFLLGTLLFALGFASPMLDGLWLRSLVVIGAATLLCWISAVVLSIVVRSLGRGSQRSAHAAL